MNAVIDVSNVRLETERLILRPWQKEDVFDLYEYASVPGVGEMAGWIHHADTAESEKILNMFISGKKTFALQSKKTGKVIGSLGIEELDPDPVAGEKYGREIGYVLSRDYWGMGLMTEAVRTVISWCFDVLGYDYLTCGYFTQNDRSRRVIEKCGFSFFGESAFETRYGKVETSWNYIIYNPNK